MDLFNTIGSSDSFALEQSLVDFDWRGDIYRVDLYDFCVFFDHFIVLHDCDKLLLAYLVTVADHIYAIELLYSCADWNFVLEYFVLLY